MWIVFILRLDKSIFCGIIQQNNCYRNYPFSHHNSKNVAQIGYTQSILAETFLVMFSKINLLFFKKLRMVSMWSLLINWSLFC